MPNLYQKKLIRGTCDQIWGVGNFGYLLADIIEK